MLLNISVAWPLDKRKETPLKFGLNVETQDAHTPKKYDKVYYMIGVPGTSRAVSRRSTRARELVKQSGWGLLLFSGGGPG